MKDTIEPKARESSGKITMLTLYDLENSKAISLKRIADALERIADGSPLNVYVKEA